MNYNTILKVIPKPWEGKKWKESEVDLDRAISHFEGLEDKWSLGYAHGLNVALNELLHALKQDYENNGVNLE